METKRPGLIKRNAQAWKSPTDLKLDGHNVQMHYDGTVTTHTIHPDTGKVKLDTIQKGWDHAKVVARAPERIAIQETLNRSPHLLASTGGLPGVHHTPLPARVTAAAAPHATPPAAPRLPTAAAPTAGVHLPAGASTVVAAAEKAPGFLSRAATRSAKFAKGAGTAVLVTGAVGGGLMLLSEMLKTPRPPRRPYSGGMDEDAPMVFNGNPDVSLGAMSVPQVGQQAQMGSWVSKLPAMDQSMGVTPTR